jgi:hypothetical protein
MDAPSTTEPLQNYNQTTRRNNPEDSHIRNSSSLFWEYSTQNSSNNSVMFNIFRIAGSAQFWFD